MSIEPGPKIFLQNKLSKGRLSLQELSPLIETKRRYKYPIHATLANWVIGKELDQLFQSVTAYTPDHTVGNIDEVSDVSRSFMLEENSW